MVAVQHNTLYEGEATGVQILLNQSACRRLHQFVTGVFRAPDSREESRRLTQAGSVVNFLDLIGKLSDRVFPFHSWVATWKGVTLGWLPFLAAWRKQWGVGKKVARPQNEGCRADSGEWWSLDMSPEPRMQVFLKWSCFRRSRRDGPRIFWLSFFELSFCHLPSISSG